MVPDAVVACKTTLPALHLVEGVVPEIPLLAQSELGNINSIRVIAEIAATNRCFWQKFFIKQFLYMAPVLYISYVNTLIIRQFNSQFI